MAIVIVALLFAIVGSLGHALSSMSSGRTITRISRPACIAKTFSTPGFPAAISSIRSSRLT